MTDSKPREAELLPCPFCGEAVQYRWALWPSEGDTDAIIHAAPTDCPLIYFNDGTFDGSIGEKWNRRRIYPQPGEAPAAERGELIAALRVIAETKNDDLVRSSLAMRELARAALAALRRHHGVEP